MAAKAFKKIKLDQIRSEDQRLRVLVFLCLHAPAGIANEAVLTKVLETYGHHVSRDALRTGLMWLQEVQLTETTMSKVWLAQITHKGQDVACGRARVPGVAVPSPEELDDDK